MMRTIPTLFFLLIFSVNFLHGQCNTQICEFPVPASNPADACVLASPAELSCFSYGTNDLLPVTLPPYWCSTVENNHWIAFKASEPDVAFTIEALECEMGSGIQAALLQTSDCSSFSFISDCLNINAGSSQVLSNNAPLQVGEVYYIMIDGQSGAICTYNIKLASGSVFTGPTEGCVTDFVPTKYTSFGLCSWTISPPGIGTPTTPNTGSSFALLWNYAGTATICATPLNGCTPEPHCIEIQINNNPTGTHHHSLCIGNTVTCGDEIFTTPGTHITIVDNPFGCDSVITCIIDLLPTSYNLLPPVVLCAPEVFEACNTIYDTSGVFTGVCQNWIGCDSFVIVDLTILEPDAIVNPPGVLGCGPGAVVNLIGSASSVAASPGTTTYLWTGPGILGANNQPNSQVNQPGIYCLKVTHQRNGVTCSDQACVTVVKQSLIPGVPLLSGPVDVCSSITATYTASAQGTVAVDGYTWTVPSGTQFTQGPANTIVVDWAGSSGGLICVTANNNCGASQPTCTNVVVHPSPTATLSGGGEFCEGSTPNLPISVALTGTPPWSVTYNDTNGQNTFIASTSPHTFMPVVVGDYLLVDVTDNGPCAGIVSGSASIVENPAPSALLSGDGSICEGSGQTVPLNIALTGEAPWSVQWSVNGQPQPNLSIAGQPFVLPISENLAGSVALGTVTDNNGCSGTANGSSNIAILEAPVVNNITSICDPTSNFYSVEFDISGGDANSYMVMPIGILSNGHFISNPIQTGAGYSFLVSDANACNSVTVADPIVVCDCETKVGNMSPTLLEICGPGTASPTYDPTGEFLDADDTRAFVLHSGSAAGIQAPILGVSDQPSFVFDPSNMSYGTVYYFSAVVGDNDGTGIVQLSDPCLQVAQGTPIVFYQMPVAELIGSGEICLGESQELLVNLSGSAPWTLTVNGQSQIAFASPHTFAVTPNVTTTYALSQVADLHCTTSLLDQATVIVHESPEIAGVQIQCDGTGTSYVVCMDLTGGDVSCYSIAPMNGSLNGTVFCSNPIPSGTGYNYTVTDCHQCPAVTMEESAVDCDCLSEVGSLLPSSVSVCANEPAGATYSPQGEVLDANDARCFVLHSGNPTQPIATNSTPMFSFQQGMNIGQSYFINAVVGNTAGNGCVDLSDPCLAISNPVTVVFIELPSAILGTNAVTCLGEPVSLPVQLTGAAPWTVYFEDGLGNAYSTVLQNLQDVLTISPNASSTFHLTSVTDSQCMGSVAGQSNVTVNQPPSVQDIGISCSADGTVFVLSFDIGGGIAGTYSVQPTGASLQNGHFTSHPIPSGSSYSFQVDDINGCGPVLVNGEHECDCVTSAGNMSGVLVTSCTNAPLTVPNTVGEFLDPTDLLQYFLHTGGNPLGTIISSGDNPSFAFDPMTMNAGITYYISAVAGNDNGSGQIDLLDECTDISNGTPVLFYPQPIATVSGTMEVCEGEPVNIFVNLTGTGPFEVSYIGNWIAATQSFPSAGTSSFLFFPNFTQQFSLTNVTDAHCSNDVSSNANIFVNPTPYADAGEPKVLDCDNPTAILGSSNNTPGVSYQWSGNVSDPSSPNPFVTTPGNFGVTITTPAGCTASDQVNIVQSAAPPTAQVIVSDVSCFGKSDGFIEIETITGGLPPYLVSFNNGPFEDVLRFEGLAPGNNKIVIVDAQGCEVILEFKVAEPIEVNVELEGNFEGVPAFSQLGEPLVLQIVSTPPFEELDTVAWSSTEALSCETCQSNSFMLLNQASFKVLVGKNGCLDEDELTVLLHKEHPIYVPNAFSPNGDQTNDLLIVYGGQQVKMIRSFRLFSRWGETVFEQFDFHPNDKLHGWNGEHKGVPMDPGVFTWYAEVEFIDGVTELFDGSLNLIR